MRYKSSNELKEKMADENVMDRSYLCPSEADRLEKQPSENGIVEEIVELEQSGPPLNQVLKSAVSPNASGESVTYPEEASENIVISKQGQETLGEEIFASNTNVSTQSTENRKSYSGDEKLIPTKADDGGEVLDGEPPAVVSEAMDVSTSSVLQNVDKTSEEETQNTPSCQQTGEEPNLIPMELVDSKPNTGTSVDEEREVVVDQAMEVDDVGDEPQESEAAEILPEPETDGNTCSELTDKAHSLRLKSNESSVDVRELVVEGQVKATETLEKVHIESECAEEIASAVSHSVSGLVEDVEEIASAVSHSVSGLAEDGENHTPQAPGCGTDIQNSVTNELIESVGKERDLNVMEDVLDKTETGENSSEKRDNPEMHESKEDSSLSKISGADRVDAVENTKSVSETNPEQLSDSLQCLEARIPLSPEATVTGEKCLEMEIDDVSVTNDTLSETSSLDPGPCNSASTKEGSIATDENITKTTAGPEQEESSRSKDVDQPVIVLEHIDESSENKLKNSSEIEEVTVLSASETSQKSCEEPAKLSAFDALRAEIPLPADCGKTPSLAKSDVTESHSVPAASTSSNSGEISVVPLSSTRSSTPPMITMECVVVSAEVQKQTTTPSSSVTVSDTITGNLPSDTDVFIVNDDGTSNAVERSRPKRNAARAADNKIKTLVLRALEPMTVEEVNEPMTQQCAQCKRVRFVSIHV